MRSIYFSLLVLTQIAAAENHEFPADQIKSLIYKNPSGNIHLAASLTKKAAVSVQKQQWAPECQLIVGLKGEQLEVIVDASKTKQDMGCRADFIISLPLQADASLYADLGNVDIIGIAGQLKVNVTSGNIRINGNVKQADVRNRQGNINFAGTATQANFRLDVGDLDIDFNEKPQGAQLSTSLGRGHLFVKLPSETKVYSETSAGNGTIRSDFTQERNSHDVKITAFAESGDIRLTKN